ncbi:acyltransferase family protein [Actinophytocola sp.]|uniref:acyltransferase family protein n=1 Tax=Actinophytocola sp. TaxID=1872138 RepID=UPI003D6A0CB6
MSATIKESPTGSGQKLRMLDGLTGFRFPIALFIFLVHSTHLFNPASGFTTPVTPFADQGFATWLSEFLIGVGLPMLSLFFMLSGFVLTWSAKPGERARAFWRRRFFRVIPNHVVTFVLACVLITGATTNWLPNLLLVHTWDPNEPPGGANVIVWSLCAELLFYSLFPFLVPLVRRIAANRLWLWAGGMVAGMATLALSVKVFVNDPVQPGILPISPMEMWAISIFPPARLFEFVLGMLLAEIVRRGKFPRIRVPVLLLTWAASWTVAQFVTVPWTYALVAVVPNALTLGAIATADLRGVKSILTSRFMVWGGNISYAFFMVQMVVVYWGRTQVPGQWGFFPALGVWFGFLGATILAAWLLFKLVEEPLMKNFSRPRRKRPAPVTRVEPALTSADGVAA